MRQQCRLIIVSVMIYSKQNIAMRQIERSIDLYLNHKDYISAISLAGAAEEMLGNIAKAQGSQSLLGSLYPRFSDEFGKYSVFSDKVNFVRNELKHSRENPDLRACIEIDESDCAVMMYRAIVIYPMVTGTTTPAMQRCWAYLQQNHSRIFE